MMLHDLDGLRVDLGHGLVATLESVGERAWLVSRAGEPLYAYALTARDQYTLDDALADATYRADAAII